MKIAMTKIDEVKIETINNSINIKWVETIENITPEILETPTYEYWQSQNQLDYEISLRNKPTTTPYIWYSFITSSTTSITLTPWFRVKSWLIFGKHSTWIPHCYWWFNIDSWWTITKWVHTTSDNASYNFWIDISQWLRIETATAKTTLRPTSYNDTQITFTCDYNWIDTYFTYTLFW